MQNSLSDAARMRVVDTPTATLIPYVGNAKTHPKAQIKKIAASIKKFGWTNPIITTVSGEVICGHGRLEAAKSLGLPTVPTIILEHLSDADRRAYIIADNALAEQSGWSKAALATELQGLAELGYDLELTGFDTLKIDTLLSFTEEDAPEDDEVELPDGTQKPVSRLGDLWQIGDQRLAVGDARDSNVYDRLLGDGRVQMIITDPPYGCAIENNVSGGGAKKHKNFVMGAGEESLGQFAMTIMRPAFKCMARYCSPGTIAFVFADWRVSPYMLDAASGVFDEVKQLIVWGKTNAGQGAFYRSAHELIYAFKVSPGEHINNFGLGAGGRHRSNLWIYPGANVFRTGRMKDLADHPTVKPKKMIADAILDCSRTGGIILDSFLGSGTTLCAAAKVGRRGRGIELDPVYADVALRRVQEETGEVAMLDGTPFAEVVAARQGPNAEAGNDEA